jgi:hypothetical protein
MRKIDRDALRRAFKMADRRPPPEADVEKWWDEAMGAVYHCQMEALRLRPWQSPPCWIGDERPRVDDHRGEVAAWKLRRRLIAAGLSEFEPDPIRMLEAAAARQRGEAPPNGRLEQVHH